MLRRVAARLVLLRMRQALAKDGARNRLEFVAQGADAYEELVTLLTAPERGG